MRNTRKYVGCIQLISRSRGTLDDCQGSISFNVQDKQNILKNLRTYKLVSCYYFI